MEEDVINIAISEQVPGESLSSIYLCDVRLSSSVIRNSFTHPLELLCLEYAVFFNTLALEFL